MSYRRYTTLFALLLLCSMGSLERLDAQPQIAYIIPDIGSPGMNTYVEIIAPVDRPGSFNPGISEATGVMPISALQIELVNPVDSQRVVVSPGVVSWDGRLVGCQFFVHPEATPGPVPIRLRVNSLRSNVDTFFIVTPQTLPAGANGPAVIGSGGAWGRRSKRGAMIVESVDLGSGTFTIDRTDTDPGTPGNQGLLPAIIISRTRVRVGPGSRFHVDAFGKDGGPGGGGGGGYGNRTGFPPVPGERDTPLGSGYTGGRSNVPVVPANSTSFGAGTGTGSTSLNGVSANSQFTTNFPTFARLFGAGPGHPFDRDGRSGGAAAAASGSGVAIFGTYYSGGGNATKGTGAPAAQDDVNGQVIGNRQIVPLHGGGGGSSGGANDSVGAGGGGGLALYSQDHTSLATVAATGADGADGCHNCGLGSGDGAGGGAGGSIIVGGKSVLFVTTVDVKGGTAGATGPGAVTGSSSGNGGSGRFRFDGRMQSGMPTVTAGASVWTGPTIDTLSLIETPLFELTGTGRFDPSQQTRIDIFMRGESTAWPPTSPTATTTVRGDSTWSASVVIPSNNSVTDSLFYVFAVQSTPVEERQSSDSATRVPSVVFSQSAANIIRYIPRPELIVFPEESYDTVLCDDGAYYYDTVIIRNRGAGTLTIERGGIYLDNPNGNTVGFGLLTNPAIVSPYQLAPGQIDTLVIRYDPRALTGSPSSVVLTVRSDDPRDPVQTHRLNVLLAYDRWYRAEPPLPGPIDFGVRLVGTSTSDTALVINTGFVAGTEIIVDTVWLTKPALGVTVASRNIPSTVPILDGDSLIIGLRYSPLIVNKLTDVELCARISRPCLDTICWRLEGESVESDVTVTPPLLEFDLSPCHDGSPVFDTVWVGNDGGAPYDFTGVIPPANAEFDVTSPSTFPVTIAPGTRVPVVVRYRPVGPSAGGILTILTDVPGSDSIEIEVQGDAPKAALEFPESRPGHDFRVSCLPDSVWLDISFRNIGTVEDTVTFRLASGAAFSFAPASTKVDAGEENSVRVKFAPTSSGPLFVDTLFVESSPCSLLDTIVLRGRVEPATYSVEPKSIDFGDVPVGSSTQTPAAILNGSTGITVSRAYIVSPDGELSVTNVTFPLTVAPLDSTQIIGVTWRPSSLKDIPPGSYLEIIIETPCPDTIQVPIIGRSIEGGLIASPNPVDFGAVVECVTISDTVWVKNFDKSQPTTLLEYWLDPSDPNFSVNLLDPTTPQPAIGPLDSVGLRVTYAPLVGPDGPQGTTLFIRTNSVIFDTLVVTARGVRFSEELSIAGPGYGTVYPNGSEVRTFTVTNTGTAPIAVNRFVVPLPFRRVAVRPQLPALLIAGGSLELDIEFAPSDTGSYVDSILVDGILQCDTIRLPISAVASEPERVRAQWGKMSGEPGDEILVPLELLDDISAVGTRSLRIDVNHDRTMLFAEGVELAGGVVPDWKVDNFTRHPGGATIEVSGSSPAAGTGTLLYLRTRVLLGENLTTTIRSTGASRFTSGTGMLTIDSGDFTLEGYCTLGSNRLVRVSGDFGIRAVVPQPTDDLITVEYETVEDGPTRLSIVDLLGREVVILQDGHSNAQVHEVQLQEKLPAGTYMLLLETRTDRDIRMIVVRE